MSLWWIGGPCMVAVIPGLAEINQRMRPELVAKGRTLPITHVTPEPEFDLY